MEFVKKILDSTLAKYRSKCAMNITDLVFLEIEKNYMTEYESECSQSNKDSINRIIGKFVRVHWDLKNLKLKGKKSYPKSKLIKSYTIHSN